MAAVVTWLRKQAHPVVVAIPLVAVVPAAIDEPDLPVFGLHVNAGVLVAVDGPLPRKASARCQIALTRPAAHVDTAKVRHGAFRVSMPVPPAASAAHNCLRILSKS